MPGEVKKHTRIGRFLHELYHTFPVQLLVNHLKKNQILLLLWALLFAFVTQQAGKMFGIPYLFLDPEYINQVGYKGFFIVGVTVGVFIMAFHITTYILDSYRFPFLGTIPRPFTHFSINNSIIPLAFVITYIIKIISFQFKSGFQSNWQIFSEVSSFIAGILLTVFIFIIYFWSTNTDIFRILSKGLDRSLKINRVSRVNVMRKISSPAKGKYHVKHYLQLPFSIKKAPEFNFYDKKMLMKVFDQNHLNAVVVEVVVILLILGLGLLNTEFLFQFPAAASVILFFSIFIMLTGAISYWLRGWAISVVIVALLALNLLFQKGILESDYPAFGLEYDKKQQEYSLSTINANTSPQHYLGDKQKTIEILENWKSKFAEEKPKMVFICSSGGGQRSSAWTTRTLQYADSALSGNLMKHSVLMTGASGGIIGSAYFRELYLRKLRGEDISLYSDIHYQNITKDVLNPVVFTLVVNDIFPRFQKVQYSGKKYLKGRGYAFEQQLSKNTNYILDKPLSAYSEPEYEGNIPMLILSPTIINDGRKLFISSQNVSYMAGKAAYEPEAYQEVKGIDFKRFFAEQNADSLRFLSALRMSATFPYITPNVQLPTEPEVEIMDAGMSDNFGILDAVNFFYVFRDWISENTGGVVFMIIRDTEKQKRIEQKEGTSIFNKFFTPIGSLYNNWDQFQDFSNDGLLEHAESWFDGDVDIVDFQYSPRLHDWEKLQDKKIDPGEVEEKESAERAVLSWHLTTREKESIKRTVTEEYNQMSLIKLKKLLTP